MSDISIRILSKPERIEYLENNSAAKRELPKIHDWMFKPMGITLDEYHPNRICLRLREFEDKTATLVELETIKADIGYQDKRKIFGEGESNDLKEKASNMGYEVWGEMLVSSVEYKILVDSEEVVVLRQTIDPIGEFLKIETGSEKALVELLGIFGVLDEEKIERNSAVLLGEKLGLIK